MKLCYFLQSLRGVPMNYSFSLYSYGPFDADVLSDLQVGESMSALKTSIIYYPSGYKYDIRPGEKASKAKELAAGFLSEHDDDIRWVASKFGLRMAAELELLSTIVYANDAERVRDRRDLLERVKLVKPHFSEQDIDNQIEWLEGEELLT